MREPWPVVAQQTALPNVPFVDTASGKNFPGQGDDVGFMVPGTVPPYSYELLICLITKCL